jgi:Trypsin-like peptidase domain
LANLDAQLLGAVMTLLNFFSVLLFSFNLHAADKIIYGADDRLEPFEFSNSNFYSLSESIAAQINKKNLQKISNSDDYEFSSKVKTLKKAFKLCADQRYINQPSASGCTGFLVSPTILITAGHCYEGKNMCKEAYWLFDYKTDTKTNPMDQKISSKNIYECKKVWKQVFDEETRIDFTIVELNRPVEGRRPLILNRNGHADVGTNLIMMGHPLGIPLKISPTARVLDISSNALITNLDSFRGNSGSPVFNGFTGEVEGILVRGKMDMLNSGGCYKPNICDENGENCQLRSKIKGEEALMIEVVLPDLDNVLSKS